MTETHLAKVKDEVKSFNELGDIYSSGEMKFGKKPTTWLEFADEPPRNYIEAAVLSFFDYAMPEVMYGDDYHVPHYGVVKKYKKSDIKGAEWWIQARSSTQGIGFHYDKDEAYASLHMRMSFPILSTVTYLTDTGAPTLILNQTSLDGSVEEPEVPEVGHLSYPRKNRHIVFRGDLNHGVASSLSLSPPGGDRLTLLVNWWTEKPMEPNCRVMTDEIAKRVGFYYPDSVQYEKSVAANRVSLSPLLNVTGTSNFGRHEESFPPGDAFYYDMPPLSDLVAGTLYEVKWDWDHVFATVGHLDLWNQNQMGSLFRIKEPKCLVFVESDADLKDINVWLQPLAKRYMGEVKVYTGTKRKAGNAWSNFGVTESDLPTAVMHDTQADRKMKLKESLGEVAVEDMWKSFLKGKSDGEL